MNVKSLFAQTLRSFFMGIGLFIYIVLVSPFLLLVFFLHRLMAILIFVFADNFMLKKYSPFRILDYYQTENDRNYLQFLEILLKSLLKSELSLRDPRGIVRLNTEIVKPILQKNLKLLDKKFEYILRNWAEKVFRNAQDDLDQKFLTSIIHNIGSVIQEFPLGNLKQNTEISITAYQLALNIRTQQALPQEWATTQNNLGNSYYYAYRFENDANIIENAINAYYSALTIRTQENMPQEWANTQNGLGCAFFDRIKGDKAENIEKAIDALEKALMVRNKNNVPMLWAETQNNLGNAYSERIRGNRADNIEKAITAFENAFTISGAEALLQQTILGYPNLGYFHPMIPNAVILCSLGGTYSQRIEGNKESNIKKAIRAYENALKILADVDFPSFWAAIQRNLSMAYLQRIDGNKEKNIEDAIEFCHQALTIFTQESYPKDWADTQHSLGFAYSDRIRGNRAENLKAAIISYHNALKIRTKENDPLNCLQTARNLANLHYEEKQWQPATEAYNLAIESVENARLEALNPHSRQEVLSNAIGIFHRIVQTYLHLNQPEKALEYIERSKGRNLVELMTQKKLQPQVVSKENIAQLNELKQRVISEQIRLQSQSIIQNLMRNDNLTPYVQDHSHLKEYQQELDDFIAREIQPIDPIFSLAQKVEPIPFADIQSLTDAETCLLQWYITRDKILAFVVSADGEVKVWQSSEEDVKQLANEIDNYLQLYYSENGKQEWRNQLSSLLQTFADYLHINEILTLIPDTCKRLIIIPHWFLHILPLHALPVSNSHFLKRGWEGSELHDLFPNGVQYAPSCQLLKIAQNSHHTEFNKLFAIQNPTKDLLFTDLEVNILSTFFAESQIIAKDNATKNTILPHLKSSDNHCHHFSCHGYFNPDNPLESALFLANQDPLTLGEIFELRLNQCRLVTLSACETGLIDLNSISDEYIGLPSGFLFAGSPSVVSSLWTVNDLSTSFLMIKFYEILFNPNLNISVAVALKQAQNWLQNLTVKEAEENLE